MKTVLIIGGSGHIGSHIAQILRGEKFKLICTYSSQKNNLPGISLCKLDITDRKKVFTVFKKYKPGIVIHCAALKNIADAEIRYDETIAVNIQGVQNIADAAIQMKSEVVIGLSSFKAARPEVSIYALSKCLMERLFYQYDMLGNTSFIALRIGSVLWAPATVLRSWERMVNESGMIKVTGFNMVRFFNTIENITDQVRIIISHHTILRGQTIAQMIRPVRLKDLLEVFVSKYGGKYTKTKEKDTETSDEFLFSDLELNFAVKKSIQRKIFYCRGFHKTNKRKLKLFSSDTIKPMNKTQIKKIIASK
ncbi:MAG: polysaccharide biosynthesis protein [Bacteroidetes bacterium]|nr:polysaccharide biosynthesis protein [Bacteroidota bacterium]